MTTRLRVLILEDCPTDAELVLHELRQAGFEPEWQCVDTEADYLDRLSQDLDVILADYSMPQFNALQALHLLQERSLDVPFIVITGSSSEEIAVECMKHGAADYLFKDRLTRLGPAVTNALLEKTLRDEKRRADESLRQCNHELAMLHRVGQALASTLNLTQVLDIVLEELRDLLSATGSSAWLIDPETDELVCHQATGLKSETVSGWHLSQGEGIASWVVRSGESLIVPDTHIDERHFGDVDQKTGLDVRSILCVPLPVKQKMIGVLQVVDTHVNHFNSADLALIEQLAATAAITIENAKLYERAQQEIAERKRAEETLQQREAVLGAIALAAEKFLRPGDWEQDIQAGIAYLGKAADMGRASVWEAKTSDDGEYLLSERYEWIAPKAKLATLMDVQNVPVFRRWRDLLPRGEIVAGHVGDLGAKEQEFFALRGIRSVLAVPVFVGGAWWGFIGFDQGTVEREWTNAEMDTLKTAASILGVTLERRQAEEKLQESEERYRSLFEGMPVGLYRATPEGQILDANPTLVEMLGYPDRQTLMVHSIASGHEGAEERRLWQSLIEYEGEVRGYETTWRCYDGTPIWVRESTRAVRGDEGQVLYYEGAVENITERKRVEDALRTSEQRFKSLYLAMNEGLCLYEAICDEPGHAVDYRIVDVNPAYESITGIEREEAVGKAASGPYGTDQPSYPEIFAKAADMGEPMSFETYFPKTDKHLRVSVFSPGKGRFATLLTDITEHLRAEGALRQKTEDLALINSLNHAANRGDSLQEIFERLSRETGTTFSGFRSAVYLLSEDKEFLVLQKQFLPPAAVSQIEKLIGMKVPQVRIPLKAESVYQGLLQTGKSQIINDQATIQRLKTECAENVMLQKTVSAVCRILDYGSVMVVPLISEGEVIGLLDVGRNDSFTKSDLERLEITSQHLTALIRRKQAEEALEEERTLLTQRVAERTAELSAANAELDRAARLKDEFLAAMSHELRTPLNAILGLSEALQEEVYGPLTDLQIKSLHTIETSGRHLLSLINDILDVSKIEAGRLELVIGPVSVESVCQASLTLVKQAAHQKQLQVTSSFDSAAPTFQADMRRMKQVLVNLLSNAVKFTPEGGAIGLEVVGDIEREALHFTVWDTGIGIASEEMDRLFKPFVQLDSSLARQHEGTGLGLVLVRRIAEMHGGGVTVESEPGKGSRFTVSLPWRQADDTEQKGREAEKVKSAEPKATPLPSRTSAPLLLLAEDNEGNINTISDYLLTMGYRVIVARDGAEAVERAIAEKPDLILMDIQMPNMDGLEATRRIRADTDPSTGLRTSLADVPIVALTALAMPGDRERCLEAGANEYLSKPVGLKGLIHTIEAQLDTRAKA